MYEFIVQFRESYLQRIFTELRETARPLIADTFDEAEPLDIAGILVHPCVNIGNGALGLNLLPETNAIELLLENVEVQLKVENEVGESESLHEMRADVQIALPLEGRAADSRVQVGVDAAAITSDQIGVTIGTGHPLADDAVLLELMGRIAQQAYTDGSFPLSQQIMDAPVTGFPFLIDAFIRLDNDDGGDPDRTIRIINAPAANDFVLIVPIEVWANIKLEESGLQIGHVQFTAELQTTFTVVRQLDNAPAFVELQISQATTELVIVDIIEGEDVLDDDMQRTALENFVRDGAGEILAGLEDPRIDTYTMDELTALLRDLIRDGLQGDGRFIEFWGAPQTSELNDAAPKVLNGILAMGVNAGLNADVDDIEPFLPDGRDFAIELSPDFFLDELDAVLIAPDDYDDVKGKLRPRFPQTDGMTTLTVSGFNADSGTVRRNTRFDINGSIYTVTADADIAPDDNPIDPEKINNIAEISFTPGLRESVGADDAITIQFGFGLPRTFDAGGNDRTVRINDLTASLEDGHIRLHGSIRIRRPHAVIKNIDGSVTLRMGLEWTSTGRADGGGQTGESLAVDDIAETIVTFPENSLVLIDDIAETFRLTSEAEVSGGNATLAITPELPQSPDNDAMVLLRWRRLGRVNGDVQIGNTLSVEGMTDGEDLIPKGTSVRVGGKVFITDADADISGGGNATLTLTRSLGSLIDEGPANDAAVRLFRAWDGRATVDGANQTGSSLVLAGIVRIVPDGRPLTIAAMNGIFTVDGETEIVNNTAALTLRHSAIETLADLTDGVDTSDLWGILGQPGDGAVVRRRTGSQETEPRLLGDPDVSLDTDLDGILGWLVGILTAIFSPGSIFIRIIAGVVAGFIVRAIVRAIISNQTSELPSDSLVSVPLPDALDDLDLGVDSHFNNPIEIRPSGILLAGSALPTTVFPDLPESRAETGGPYDFDAGVKGGFSGGNDAPKTEYLWRSGNGAFLAGLTPNHTYPQRGFYVADLSSFDRQLEFELRTRHLAAVRVRNSLPKLGVLPVIAGKEGEEVELTVSFSDIAWTDTHRALVDFGDGSFPVEAEITEINQPPETTGQLTARHTYCDNGIFLVDVILTDAQGGTDRQTTEALIENVPPVVEAGEDMFAHPCVALRLAGYFEDQGWCDTHTGTWDFGDCSPLFPATIVETNDPPKARGHAYATHCYTVCGTFLATLTIRDDDGAEASDTLVVRYSDLLNGDFEDGFQPGPMGKIGNDWTGYAVPLTSNLLRQDVFDCETCAVCSGARAQAILAPGYGHAGIRQSLGVNPGWEYQFAAVVSVPTAPSTVWLGIDPAGGIDRESGDVVWTTLAAKAGWQRLSNRAVAVGRSLTVFLEVRDPGQQPVIFDCITMQAYPCPIEEQPPEDPGDPEPRCVSWQGIDPILPLPPQVMRDGFTFATLSGIDLRIVTFGQPQGDTKLFIPDRNPEPGLLDGLRVKWDGSADTMFAEVSGPPNSSISLVALDAVGAVMDTVSNSDGGIRTLTLAAPGIAAAEIHSEHRGTLLRICLDQPTGKDHPGDLTGPNGPRDPKDPKEPKEPRKPKEPKDPNYPHDPKNPKGP